MGGETYRPNSRGDRNKSINNSNGEHCRGKGRDTDKREKKDTQGGEGLSNYRQKSAEYH